MRQRVLWIGMSVMIVLLGTVSPALALPAEWTAIEDEGWLFHALGKPSPAQAIGQLSLAVNPNDGVPWVSYFDSAGSGLWVAHEVGSGGNCGSDSRWQCDNVDWNVGSGEFNTIAIYPGDGFLAENRTRIGVAYYKPALQSLFYAEYSCPEQACSWTSMIIDYPSSPASAGRYPSLSYDDNGIPWIAYQSYPGSGSVYTLKVAHKVDAGGNCGANRWQCDAILTGDQIGFDISLQAADGVIQIMYYDMTGGDLEYLWYEEGYPGECGPGNTWHCLSIDTANTTGARASFLYDPSGLMDANRWVAYYNDQNGGTLRLAYVVYIDGNCGNIGGVNRWQCMDIASDIGAWYPDYGVTIAQNARHQPVIVYYDANGGAEGNGALMIARRVADLGLSEGNCGLVESVNQWQCEVLDDGLRVMNSTQAHDVGLFADVDFTVRNEGCVAYLDAAAGQVNLLQQNFEFVFLPALLR